MSTQQDSCPAAIDYAARGWRIIPLSHDSKKPCIKTGKASGVVVIHVDGPEGEKSLEEIQGLLGPLPGGALQGRTPRGGGDHLTRWLSPNPRPSPVTKDPI